MSFWHRIALLLSLTACQATSPPRVAGSVVDVGGRSLHIHCVGEGAPVVVFDAGLGDDGSTWSQIQPEVGRITRACVYDRAGTGSSSAAPRPHTSRQMVEELHALLGRAGVAGPYVLVGHSLGGLNVRLYASAHAAEVVGMVLIDATTEDQDTRFWGLLPSETLRAFQTGLRDNREGLDYEAFRASMADLRGSKRSLGDMPLVVLTHGKEDSPPPGVSADIAAKMARVWREMQSELPRLSSNSMHVIAENSHHYIQWEASRLVVAAVREVVRVARTHAHLDANVLSPLSRLPRETAP
jgi:pimeloyl-ACP methyl ester carboxylesterase